jgi:hypothetical protein
MKHVLGVLVAQYSYPCTGGHDLEVRVYKR